jgi:hypothetical protein
MSYPSPPQVVAALAKAIDSSQVAQVLAALGVSWVDTKPMMKDLTPRFVEAASKGFTISFDDEGVLLNKPFHDDGDGPYVVTSFTFWGYKKNFTPYPALLPFDLLFGDTRAIAAQKLGTPTTEDEEWGVHTWVTPECRLSIEWAKPKQISAVTLWMLRPD